jgi:peroxygenase
MPSTLTNGSPAITSSIPSVPVTSKRTPFTNPKDRPLPNAGEPRANLAPSVQSPHGTTENDWAKEHSHQTVLQQHCDFFDRDHDGTFTSPSIFPNTLR